LDDSDTFVKVESNLRNNLPRYTCRRDKRKYAQSKHSSRSTASKDNVHIIQAVEEIQIRSLH